MKTKNAIKKCLSSISMMCLVLFLLGISNQQIVAAPNDVNQQREITGTVIDTEGLPLIGVAVTVKGHKTGIITDLDGQYKISVPDSKAELQFSFIGFKSQTIVVGNKSVIDLIMHEDLQNLEEVVVVGYGVQKKSHLTGSITKVNTAGLEDIPVSRVDQALQGRVAGVQVQDITSEVGEAPQVRVRGMGSIGADKSPLIIIDGFPVDGGLGVVNMNDIESIEVLKDAASAAIYGSRAASGVIIITTKQGVVDKPKYTVKTMWGIKDAYKKNDILSSQQYADLLVREAEWKGLPQMDNQDFSFTVLAPMNDTDWQDQALRTANIYSIQLGISGGKTGVKYYNSVSYIKDEGIMVSNNFEKINLRSKIDINLTPKVTVGVNIAPTYSYKRVPPQQFIDYYRTPAWMPVRHTEETSALTGYKVGSYANGADFNNVLYKGVDPLSGEEREVRTSPFNTANHNPVMVMDNEQVKQHDYRLQSSAYINIKLMKGLEFKTSNGFDVSYRETDRYRNRDAKKDGETNRGLYQNRLYINLVSENTLNYITKINKDHDINILAGFSGETTKTNTAGILGIEFPNDNIHTLNAAGYIRQYDENDKLATGTWKQSAAMMSVYGRAIYSYKDRYLFSGSFRADGSSKFGMNNRWANFPSASFGWRASEEQFMKELTWMDQLKLRASYGVTGTDKIANYANVDLMYPANYILGSGSGTLVPGLANNWNTLGNYYLKWEQTNEFNMGFDLSVLNSRVGLAFDYYYSKTKSLLFQRPINSITGYTAQWANLGKIRNKGVEIELTTYNFIEKDFSWTTAINFSANKNKALDFGGPRDVVSSGEREEKYLSRVGDPSIQFFGYKVLGVWTQEQLDDPSIARNAQDVVGGLRVWDADGDGKITDADKVAIGNPFPDFTWGITNKFKYRHFDLSILIQGVQGIDVWNGDVYYNETRKWNAPYVMNRWVSDDHPGNGKDPGFNRGINIMETDYGIQDGSYFSLRDITAGYTLPSKTTKKYGISGLRFYASVQNLGYWWTGDYRGINPEARMTSGAYSNPLIAGYQRGGFPLQRTFSFGIDFNF